MPNINFDGSQRRDAKEPQITKNELLETPQRSAFGGGWTTPRTNGISDLIASGASWGFDSLNTPGTPASSSRVPTKQEPVTPAPDMQLQGHQDTSDDDVRVTASEKRKDSVITVGRRGSGTASKDKYGRKSGVIDLTALDSDDEVEQAMPEHQLIPDAKHDGITTRSAHHDEPILPRPYTNGLAPYAPHPRKPAPVNRSKPPIKPIGRQRKPASLSHSPAAPVTRAIVNQGRRRLPNQSADLSFSETPARSSSVRTLELTPLGDTTDTMSQTPDHEANPVQRTTPATSAPSVPQKALGPFMQEDDSSDEESQAGKEGKEVANTTRKTHICGENMAHVTKRPRNDTPARTRKDVLAEQSRAMRARARERAQEELLTRANTVAPTADRTALDTSDDQAFLGLPHPRRMP